GADAGGDDLEAVVGVDHLDDGHRPDQEEHDLRGGGNGLVELTADQYVVPRRSRVDGPEQARAEQRRRALVDPDGMLERDRRISEDEDGGERNQQGGISLSGVSD